MEDFEPKKLLILRILSILQDHTDCDHRLKQVDIIRLLKIEYGLDIERKAVARNLDFLSQAGYEIDKDKDGVCLLNKIFVDGELRLLIDSVLSNRNICTGHTKKLVKKLQSLGTKNFKDYTKYIVNHDDWQKQPNQNFFLNIEIITEAISNKKKIMFFYSEYGLDKKLHKEDHKKIVNPYQLILKNDKYYLACNFDKYDNLTFIRVDKMSDIEILEDKIKDIKSIKNYEKGISLGNIHNRLPYMFDGSIEEITFESTNNVTKIIDNVIDWFGYDFRVSQKDNGEYIFKVKASPKAMKFWLLQYGKFVKVLSPQSLVDAIKYDISEMQKLYEN